MLIEFTLGNYLSVCEKQTLSMAASGLYRELPENTFSTDLPRLPRLLKSAVIYGPNAAGKSIRVRRQQ